jgi:hypothetical protein
VSESTPAESWHARLVLPVVGLRAIEGRVGSTLLMQLLASSPEVVLDRRYPYGEYRYFSYCVRAASFMLRPPVVGLDPGVTELFFGVDGRFGPLPFEPDSLDRHDAEPAVAAALWSTFSGGFLRRHPSARCYAEKLAVPVQAAITAGIPLKVIDCVRDPRDIFVSIREFVAATGFDGFGRRPGDTEDDYLTRFIGTVADRLDEMATTPPGLDRITLRYEDFARDVEGCADRLQGWLGIALDPAALGRAGDGMERHRTSRASTLRSTGGSPSSRAPRPTASGTGSGAGSLRTGTAPDPTDRRAHPLHAQLRAGGDRRPASAGRRAAAARHRRAARGARPGRRRGACRACGADGARRR